MVNKVHISKKLFNKTTLFLFCAFVLVCMGVAGIYAYLSDGDKASNTFTIGGNRVGITEEFEPPEKLEPGVEFKKDVSVTNVGPSDCYVRVKAVFTDSDMEKYCTVDFNSSSDANDRSADYWYNSEDGYYYYKEILESGDRSPSLFTKVSISEDIPANEIKEFDILVYVESYQSAGFDNYRDAWAHYHRNDPSNS